MGMFPSTTGASVERRPDILALSCSTESRWNERHLPIALAEDRETRVGSSFEEVHGWE
jgi:hypothetical protein